MTQIDTDKLRALVQAATPGDLSTATRHTECETVECPACQGDGELDAADYCNFDGVALGVQFYGIGGHFGAHEALWRYFVQSIPAILAMAEDNRRLKLQIDALLPHTSHAVGCAIYQKSWALREPDCSCGLEAARQALAAPGDPS
ncbi:hypothetical protein [Novosphingobium clariflavum]|uniref:Uncharacterized protein n=1 Tax=Novosphingobium clariflavum TaxID=2029884 RepID=A0ABV6S850_9SPHN|nr:hypothetical protein [Novosphingobium clariflavum]